VSRRNWFLLGLLASFWGASYLFIKLGLEDLSPAMVVFARTALAAGVLFAVAARLGALRGVRGRLGPIAVLAIVQVAGPFLLIAAGERHISSSLAGILVATAPIFTALLAIWVDQAERSHGFSLAGVVIGMVGVAVLLGVDAGSGTATMAISALVTLPVALASAPDAMPGAGAIAAVGALGVVGTGIAFWIFYTLISTVGPAKASIVAYIAPGFAVVYGVALLGESFTPGTAAGLALIVGGSWLAADGRRRRGARRSPRLRGAPVRRARPVGRRRRRCRGPGSGVRWCESRAPRARP
jgi:drug/metabolite transporter (DMT)-like permease